MKTTQKKLSNYAYIAKSFMELMIKMDYAQIVLKNKRKLITSVKIKQRFYKFQSKLRKKNKNYVQFAPRIIVPKNMKDFAFLALI